MGPIGLVLSSPLTVCLVMLGRYVPTLEFLAVILGDEPALDPRISFYQRLLARDQTEAEDLILEHLKTESPQGIYDAMLIPTLSAAKVSRGRGDITEADEHYVWQAIGEIVEDLAERDEKATAGANPADETGSSAVVESVAAIPVFGCPAHDRADQAALEMLANVLDPGRWDLTVMAPETLAAELLDEVARARPALVCLAATAPGGLAHTRYLCKRLKARFPNVRILVCRFGAEPHTETKGASLIEAGADQVTTTLLDARQTLASLMPVLAQFQSQAQSQDDASEPGDSGGEPVAEGRNRSDQGRRYQKRAMVAHTKAT